MTTRVLVRCGNCGAEPHLPATLVTLCVDLTEDRAAVVFACPLCGADTETVELTPNIQTALLDGGCQLAARSEG